MQLYNAIAERQNRAQNRRAILGELVCVDHVKTPREAARRADELRSDPVLRGVHADALRFCRTELVADNCFHAVLEASKRIAEKLRTRTGLSDEAGKLFDAAFFGSSPLLAINSLAALERIDGIGDPLLRLGEPRPQAARASQLSSERRNRS